MDQRDSDVFLAKRVSLHPIPDGRVAALDPEAGKCVLLDHLQADLLQALSTPADLSILEGRLVELGWDNSSFRELPGYVEALRDQQLITGVSELTGQDYLSVRGPAPFRYQGWPTKNKPEAMQRSLDDWAAFYHKCDLNPSFIVSDDSGIDAERVCAAANAIAESGTQDVYYLNRDGKRRFASLFPPSVRESVEFALGLESNSDAGNDGFGANQNCLLLLTAGAPSAMVDDDMVPDFLRRYGAADDRTALYSGLDPTSLEVVKNWPDFEEIGERISADTYMRNFTESERRIDYSHADILAIDEIKSGKSYIAAKCFCSWGDSGMGSASYLLANRGQIGADISDPDDYCSMMRDRLAFRAPKVATIGGKAFMSGHCVLYPDPLLPPFSPTFRNQDGLWGSMLEKMQPGAKIMYSELAIKHDPPQPRAGSRERAVEWQLGVNETVQLLVGFLATTTHPDVDHYHHMGLAIENFCSGSKSYFREALSGLVVQAVLGRQRMLFAALNEFREQPKWWAEDVYASIDWLDQYLTTEKLWLPAAFHGREQQFADYCTRFGALLQAWPDIYRLSESCGPETLASSKLN